MKDFSELKGQQPEWRQPKTGGRVYELRLDDKLFAVLTFRSAFGSYATAEFSGGKYTFKRVGFFTPHVTIRREGEEADLAVYRPNWTGAQGMLDLDGKTFSWRPANFWATRYAWYAGKEVLLHYRQGVEDKHFSDLFKTQAQVELTEAAWDLQGLPLLVLLGWYLVVLYEQDSAAVAATSAAVS
jgi:hypothetical protein